MSWSSLPDDVVHLILAKVCLVNLAGITTTCSSFRAAYRRRMALEQEARRQLAVNTCGAERIACLLDLSGRLFRREPLPAGFVDGSNKFWIRADGVVHVPVSSGSPYTSRRKSPGRFKDGDILVCLWRSTRISLQAYNERGLMFHVKVWHRLMQPVQIEVPPTCDEDVVPVALLQVLLSEGLTQVIRDLGLAAKIRIGAPFIAEGVTQAGLKALIAPLLPFAVGYTRVEAMGECPVWECMLIGHVRPPAKRWK